jgi:hypothetical protein
MNGKIGELEGYVVRLKKQNDHLKSDNLRLAEIIETEAQTTEPDYRRESENTSRYKNPYIDENHTF